MNASPVRNVTVLAALALSASAQVELVQKTPADIGTTMLLEVTDATPGAPIWLVESAQLHFPPIAAGAPGAPGGPPRFHFLLGTSSPAGTLSAGVALPPSLALLGKLIPMRAIDLGAFPAKDGSALSNPLKAWIGPQPLKTSPAAELWGSYGFSVAVGDFVGTSALDVAVGAVLETVSGAFGAGKVYVYEGPEFTSVTTLTAPVPSVGGDFGWSLAALDWNGDGATDLAVGEPGKDGLFPFTNIGAVHVFTHPVGASAPATFGDPTPVAYEQMGVALARAALDATPNDELVVGASFNGAVKPAGVFATVKFLAYSGGSAIFSEVAEPVAEDQLFGHSLAAGDVDGDGLDEVLVGAANHDEPGAFDCGAAYLIDGGAVVLPLLDDAPLTGEKFGQSVAIGDLDGDALGDLLIGVLMENHAQLYLAPGFAAGSPIVLPPAHPGDIHGGRSVAIADVDGDGRNDALVAAGSCVSPGPGAVCGSVTAYFGHALAASAYVADAGILPWSLAAGDLDGDGRDEIVVGHPGASPMFLSGAGAVLVSK
jgi:hypothetical protein